MLPSFLVDAVGMITFADYSKAAAESVDDIRSSTIRSL